MIEDRVVSPEYLEDDLEEIEEVTLRPNSFSEYVGQNKVKENLKVYITSAKKEEKHLIMYFCTDHLDLERQLLHQ